VQNQLLAFLKIEVPPHLDFEGPAGFVKVILGKIKTCDKEIKKKWLMVDGRKNPTIGGVDVIVYSIKSQVFPAIRRGINTIKGC